MPVAIERLLMTPTVGSPLSLMPATHGEVRFFTEGEKWEQPLIGYAVVVSWSSVDDPDHPGEKDEYETRIEPVVMNDQQVPLTVGQYMASGPRGITRWKIVLP